MLLTRDELTRLLFTPDMPTVRLDDGTDAVLLAIEKENGSGRCFNLTVRFAGAVSVVFCRIAETVPEKIERIVRQYPDWSKAERARLDDIVAEVIDHCANGGGNRFIRDWCHNILVPQIRPLFS